MAQRKEISIQFIAEKCGVSIATVSRVLNNDKRVAPKTRERILSVMDEYHYIAPSAPAPSVKKIGVVIDTGMSDYYMALVQRIHKQLGEDGIQVIVGSLGHDPKKLPSVLETMYDSNLSGLILVTCPYLAARMYLNQKLPHVWIDCNDPAESTGEICHVQSDHYYSGMLAAQELFKKGCVHPILISGSLSSHRMRDRIRGLRDEYRKHGIEVTDSQLVEVPYADEILAESRQKIRYLVSIGYEFDSVFAISDWRALGVYLALTEMGIRVPEDVKLIGFDGVSVASRTILNITSVQQNIAAIARTAADLLLKQLAHETITEKRVIIPTAILSGQTL